MITATPIKSVGGYPNGADGWQDSAQLYRLSSPAEVQHEKRGTLGGEYVVVVTRPEEKFEDPFIALLMGGEYFPAATGVFFTDSSGAIQDESRQYAAHLIHDVEDIERGLTEFLDLINA